MKTVRLRDTAPEVALRRELYRLGLRYRLHRAVLTGVRRRPDIVFGAKRVVVFVDGCFWHGCPEHGTMAKANRSFWLEKIRTNRRRDRDTDSRLEREGWRVIRVWEHEAPERGARRVVSAVRARRRDGAAVGR